MAHLRNCGCDMCRRLRVQDDVAVSYLNQPKRRLVDAANSPTKAIRQNFQNDFDFAADATQRAGDPTQQIDEEGNVVVASDYTQ